MWRCLPAADGKKSIMKVKPSKTKQGVGRHNRSVWGLMIAAPLGVFLMGLLLGLVAASFSSTAKTETRSETAGPVDDLVFPWQTLRSPDAGVGRISSIVHKEGVSSSEKLQKLSQYRDNDGETHLVRGLASFAAGVNRIRSKQPERAAQWFSSPHVAATELSGHALYLIGKAFEKTKPEAAREALHRLTEEDPDFVSIDEARFRYGRLLTKKGRWKEAAEQLRKTLDEGRRESRGEALFELAGSLSVLEKKEEAAVLLEELYYEMPTHRLSRDAGRRLKSLRKFQPKRSAEESYRLAFERAERLYRAEQYRSAYSDYTQLLSSFKNQVDRELVNLRRGVCQYHRRQSRSAEATLGRIEREELQPEALYYRAEAARRLRKRATYKERLDNVMELDPDGPWAEEALWSLARFNVVEDDMDEALSYYGRLAREFPEGKYYVQAMWRILWDQYRSGRYGPAAEGFDRTAREHPEAEELSRFLYWGARAYQNAGRFGRAEDLYRQVLLGFKNTYYGRKAAEHLAKLVGERKANAVTEAGRDGIVLREGFHVVRKPTLRRIEQLMAVGLLKEAETEAERAVQGERDDMAFLAALAWIHYQQDDFREGIITVRRSFPFHAAATGDLLPKEIWEVLYPLKYWDSIEKYSADHDVDPYVVAALIRQESTFNPKVRSPAGARGLMQIMPYTGRILARQHSRRYRTQDLYNPEINIRYGTHYLKEVLDRFDGRLDYALASYNAGPHRVRAWTGMNLTLDSEEFIEEIPFTETRNYVKLVLRNEMLYRRLYGRSSAGID
jgi:soluble lytic murein transglycosylase